MKVLLDTHAFLWFLNGDPKLTRITRALIEDPANRKFVGVASCWEMSIKAGLRKLDLGEPATTFLPRQLAANGFDLLGINLTHATFVESLPPRHKDPFDRLLVAQSVIENLQSRASVMEDEIQRLGGTPIVQLAQCPRRRLAHGFVVVTTQCIRDRRRRRAPA